jgi:hypothetical protein
MFPIVSYTWADCVFDIGFTKIEIVNMRSLHARTRSFGMRLTSAEGLNIECFK